MSAALLAYLAARKRHKAQKKRRDIDEVIEALKDDEDREEDRVLQMSLTASKEEGTPAQPNARARTRAREHGRALVSCHF